MQVTCNSSSGPVQAGSGVLTYIVAPNLSSGPHSGTLLVAGREVTITQAGGGVIEGPAVSEQPQSQTVTEGESVTFSVTATGSAPLAYQWSKDGAVISGATDSTYTITGVATSNAGSYTVTVSNVAGSVTSNAAILTVQTDEPEMVYHPADTDQDSVIKIAEVTTYGRAWKKGETWSVEPNPISIAYVTRAGILWKKGEGYSLDQSQVPPLCWVSAVVSKASSTLALCTIEGEVVTITVTPNSDVGVYAVEDVIPERIGVTAINENGEFDSVNRKVKWGPWFDNQPRTLTYTLVPGSFSGTATLSGLASFDGTNVAIKGAREYTSDGENPVGPPVIAPAYFGGILITGTVGGVYVIEYSNDNITWIFADEITLMSPSRYWADLTPDGEHLRFYRAKVKE